MKTALIMIASLFFAISSNAQLSTVTATVSSFANGTAAATFVNGGGGNPPVTSVTQPINSSGFFRMSLAPNTAPAFSPSSWSVQICAQAPSMNPTCYTASVSITQSTQDITQSFSAAPTVIALGGYQPSGAPSLPVLLGANLSLMGNTLNAAGGGSGSGCTTSFTGPVYSLSSTCQNAIDVSELSMYLSSGVPGANGGNNTLVGYDTGTHLSGTFGSPGGDSNVFIGTGAGSKATTARSSILIGAHTGGNLTGAPGGVPGENTVVTVVGNNALATAVDSYGPAVIMGEDAALAMTTGGLDVILGTHSGSTLVNSSSNVLVGDRILDATTGTAGLASNNTFVGGGVNNQGVGGIKTSNTGVGHNAFLNMGAAVSNTALGEWAGGEVSTGTFNTFLGANAGGSVILTGQISGDDNLGIGDRSGQDLTTGSNNVFMGSQTGAGVSTGNDEVCIMINCNSSPTGVANISIGYDAGSTASGLDYYVAIGRSAAGGTTGFTSVGSFAGANSTLDGNSFFGFQSGMNSRGSNITAIGNSAAMSLDTTETDDTAIGFQADFAAGVSNAIQIGTGANTVSGTVGVGDGTNEFNLGQIAQGNFNITTIKGAAVAPTGACTTGLWEFSQDGKLSFCKASVWEVVTTAP